MIATNAGNIASNASNIAVNASNIVDNRSYIGRNAATLVEHGAFIERNAGHIAMNSERIGANAAAITMNSGLISDNRHQQVEDRLPDGGRISLIVNRQFRPIRRDSGIAFLRPRGRMEASDCPSRDGSSSRRWDFLIETYING